MLASRDIAINAARCSASSLPLAAVKSPSIFEIFFSRFVIHSPYVAPSTVVEGVLVTEVFTPTVSFNVFSLAL